MSIPPVVPTDAYGAGFPDRTPAGKNTSNPADIRGHEDWTAVAQQASQGRRGRPASIKRPAPGAEGRIQTERKSGGPGQKAGSPTIPIMTGIQ
jgi:hypothetical protein